MRRVLSESDEMKQWVHVDNTHTIHSPKYRTVHDTRAFDIAFKRSGENRNDTLKRYHP